MGVQARVVPVAGGLPLRVLRVRQWIHFVALPLAGGTRALPLATAALLLGYAYGLNAISDRATDLDARKNPLTRLAICPRSAVAVVLAAGAAAFVMALSLGPVARVAAAVSLSCATVYSVGPRGKRVPVAGTLLNLGIFAPLLWLGIGNGAAGSSLPPSFALQTATFAVLLVQNQLLHERADAAEDRAAGVRSTAHVLGARGTRVAIVALAAMGLVGARLAAGPSAVAAAGIVASTFAALAFAPDRRRLAHRWVAFAFGAALFAAGVGL